MAAVPASASIAVLVRYAISRYLESDLYHGVSDRDALKDETTTVISVEK
jgi:hypothetical protein